MGQLFVEYTWILLQHHTHQLLFNKAHQETMKRHLTKINLIPLPLLVLLVHWGQGNMTTKTTKCFQATSRQLLQIHQLLLIQEQPQQAETIQSKFIQSYHRLATQLPRLIQKQQRQATLLHQPHIQKQPQQITQAETIQNKCIQSYHRLPTQLPRLIQKQQRQATLLHQPRIQKQPQQVTTIQPSHLQIRPQTPTLLLRLTKNRQHKVRPKTT